MTSSYDHRNDPICAINVTPLVDVMLVLLIAFMIAAPLATSRIGIDLPQHTENDPKPSPPIRLTIEADGALRWDGSPLTRELLALQLQLEASKQPQPLLQIVADPMVEYQVVADVIGSARDIGMTRIGFERFASEN